MKAKPTRHKTIKGILASPGIAIGKAHVLDKFHMCLVKRTIEAGSVKSELARFNDAIETSRKRMIETTKESAKSVGKSISMILHPQIQVLNDPALISQTRLLIENERVNAEWALKETFENLVQRFRKIKDPYFRDRLHDIEVVVSRVLQLLSGAEHESLATLNESVIVISHDLTPFDTVQMATKQILGFVTEIGGKTSHTGIIASSLNIPALVGVPRITSMVETGDIVILDAINGNVIVKPTQEEFQIYNRERLRYVYLDREMEKDIGLAAETKDGVKIVLKANIESSEDIGTALELGANGIGLYRTEFLYVSGGELPDEETQFREYKKVAKTVAPNDAIIRTLDVGGDKITDSFEEDPDPNPALGLRAIRYSFKYPDIFKTQIRAILRASHYGKLKVMYPLISSIEELRIANRILKSQKRELKEKGIPFDNDIKVGIMIETPSAALLAEQFAGYVDFFSIGTNDLIQYVLVVDRGNEKVANLYQPLHPAVLQILSMVIRAANRQGIPVSVCGKMSADPLYAYVLMGMGEISHLSMESHAIPKVKKFIRNISLADAMEHVRKILGFHTVREVKKYLLRNVSPMVPEGIFSETAADKDGQSLHR